MPLECYTRLQTFAQWHLLRYLRSLQISVHVILSDVNPKERVVDLTDQPDLLPAIAVLALKNKGKTTITALDMTKYKETDRIAVITEELAKTGVTINST